MILILKTCKLSISSVSEGCEYGSVQSSILKPCLPHAESVVFSIFFFLCGGGKVKSEVALFKNLPQLIFVNAIESSILLLANVIYLLSYFKMFILS